ncbi:hypothetical protein MRB53_036377 [Persea americana]|nr:hypothetical protein MRB53_036377 [Persea americana]
MKERRAGGLGRANSFWEKKGTESPELREGKEVVGGAGGHFSRSIPKDKWLVRFVLLSTQFSVFVRDHVGRKVACLPSHPLEKLVARRVSPERSDEEAKLSTKLCFPPCSRSTRLVATLIQKLPASFIPTASFGEKFPSQWKVCSANVQSGAARCLGVAYLLDVAAGWLTLFFPFGLG